MLGGADREAAPEGGIEAAAASWTMRSEEDGSVHHLVCCRVSTTDLRLAGWDGAGAPGGASPRPEPGAGSAGRGAAGAALI
jgi:hypothetical protein